MLFKLHLNEKEDKVHAIHRLTVLNQMCIYASWIDNELRTDR